MLQVLGLFLVSSQTGKAVSRKLILYSLGRGETIIDKAIAVLVATKFIRSSDDSSWVLSRDLSSAMLSELCSRLKLDLGAKKTLTGGAFYAIEVWRSRLINRLGAIDGPLNQDGQEIDISIRDLLEGRPDLVHPQKKSII